MRRGVWLAWTVLLLGAASPRPASADGKAEVLVFDNGLTVVLRVVRSASSVGVVTALPFGRDLDVAGGRGLAEVVVRTFATAAAGSFEARPPLSLQAISKDGTRERSVTVERRHATVRVLVAGPAQVPAALEEVSARLGALAATEAQFASVRDALAEGRQPPAAWPSASLAEHAARQAARGEPWDVDPIGSTADLGRLRWEDVRAVLAARCVPRGAVVAVVGDFDAGAVRALAQKRLKPLASPPAAATAPEPPPGAPAAPPADPTVVRRSGGPATTAAASDAAVALLATGTAVPADLAPVLVLAARLHAPERAAGIDGFAVAHDVLDDPFLVVARAPVPSGKDATAAATALRARFPAAARGAVGAKDVLAVRFWYAAALGLPLVDGSRGLDVVETAALDARRTMLGWDGAAILAAVQRTKEADLRRLVDEATVRGAVTVPGG
ncbi:MAG: insulinase family protein [Planctomycetes bacterium]|nr:insulinase family protein [Planctomycetota bacterium]